MSRLGLSVCAFLAALAGAIGYFGRGASKQTLVDPSAVAEPVAEFGVIEPVLVDLQRAWIPRKRNRIIAGIADSEPIALALEQLLTHGSRHPRLLQAIALAVDLDQARFAAPLRQLVLQSDGPVEQLRIKALIGAEHLEPWGGEALRALLQTRIGAPMRVALLDLLANRSDLSLAMLEVSELLEFLTASQVEIRRAAWAALPDELSEELQFRLFDLAERDSLELRVERIAELGRFVSAEAVEQFLNDRLSSQDAVLRVAALRALAQKSRPLRDLPAIHGIIRDHSASLHERAHAFLVVEKTRSFEQPGAWTDLWPTHAVLEYHAARCLLALGDKRGARKLLDLVDGPPAAPPAGGGEFAPASADDARANQQVAHRCRTLLGELSGAGPYATLEQLAAWYDSLTDLEPVDLPAPTIDD